MLSRVTRGLFSVSLYTNKRRQLPVNHQYCLARQLSQSAIRYVTNQVEDKTDLMFDLGGEATGEIDHGTNESTSKRRIKKVKSKQQNAKREIPEEKQERSFEQLKYHDLALDLKYVKLPFNHPELAKLMLMLKSRKYRDQNKLLLLEGRRLTLEAVEAGLKLRYLLFSNVKQIETIRREIQKAFTKKTEFIRVPHNDLSFWSTLTTCPGLITAFDRPTDMNTIWENRKQIIINKLKKQQRNEAADASTTDVSATDDDDNDGNANQLDTSSKLNSIMISPAPITVICDQVREPNNLGGIIRTCAALPCSKVILLKGCADPWDVKALRGGCGAQFRVPIIGPIEWEELNTHLPAANDMSVFIADNQTEDNEMQIQRDHYELKRKQNNAPFFHSKAYNDILFHNCKHIALIIGGETEGVSSHAFDFMNFISKHTEKPTNDDCNELNRMPDNAVIEIPLGNGVESLNASVATGILLFEMRKQLLQ